VIRRGGTRDGTWAAAGRDLPRWPHPISSTIQLTGVGIVGVCVGVPVSVWLSSSLGPLVGWDAAALSYLIWAWSTIWPMGPTKTAQLASREDPNRPLRDILLLAACVASLVAVAFVLAGARGLRSPAEQLHIGLGVVSVLLSWAVVHTVFTARYARLYYTGNDSGIIFNQSMPPRYADFAYVAFTVAVTFQVSDTNLTSSTIRKAVLRHALLSYLFSVVIIGTTINLIAGLAR
jgi:uncharacterized membrane protein